MILSRGRPQGSVRSGCVCRGGYQPPANIPARSDVGLGFPRGRLISAPTADGDVSAPNAGAGVLDSPRGRFHPGLNYSRVYGSSGTPTPTGKRVRSSIECRGGYQPPADVPVKSDVGSGFPRGRLISAPTADGDVSAPNVGAGLVPARGCGLVRGWRQMLRLRAADSRPYGRWGCFCTKCRGGRPRQPAGAVLSGVGINRRFPGRRGRRPLHAYRYVQASDVGAAISRPQTFRSNRTSDWASPAGAFSSGVGGRFTIAGGASSSPTFISLRTGNICRGGYYPPAGAVFYTPRAAGVRPRSAQAAASAA